MSDVIVDRDLGQNWPEDGERSLGNPIDHEMTVAGLVIQVIGRNSVSVGIAHSEQAGGLK